MTSIKNIFRCCESSFYGRRKYFPFNMPDGKKISIDMAQSIVVTVNWNVKRNKCHGVNNESLRRASGQQISNQSICPRNFPKGQKNLNDNKDRRMVSKGDRKKVFSTRGIPQELINFNFPARQTTFLNFHLGFFCFSFNVSFKREKPFCITVAIKRDDIPESINEQ